jgi:hypothetical protein
MIEIIIKPSRVLILLLSLHKKKSDEGEGKTKRNRSSYAAKAPLFSRLLCLHFSQPPACTVQTLIFDQVFCYLNDMR